MCRSSLDPKFLGMNLGLKRQADHLVHLDAFSPEMSFALGLLKDLSLGIFSLIFDFKRKCLSYLPIPQCNV